MLPNAGIDIAPGIKRRVPETASLTAGFVHPFAGFDHVMVMLMGLWAAEKGGRALWAWPAVFVGVMLFDVADLNNLQGSGLLPTVILHEMQHVLGFGSIWTQRGVLFGREYLQFLADRRRRATRIGRLHSRGDRKRGVA